MSLKIKKTPKMNIKEAIVQLNKNEQLIEQLVDQMTEQLYQKIDQLTLQMIQQLNHKIKAILKKETKDV